MWHHDDNIWWHTSNLYYFLDTYRWEGSSLINRSQPSPAGMPYLWLLSQHNTQQAGHGEECCTTVHHVHYTVFVGAAVLTNAWLLYVAFQQTWPAHATLSGIVASGGCASLRIGVLIGMYVPHAWAQSQCFLGLFVCLFSAIACHLGMPVLWLVVYITVLVDRLW